MLTFKNTTDNRIEVFRYESFPEEMPRFIGHLCFKAGSWIFEATNSADELEQLQNYIYTLPANGVFIRPRFTYANRVIYDKDQVVLETVGIPTKFIEDVVNLLNKMDGERKLIDEVWITLDRYGDQNILDAFDSESKAKAFKTFAGDKSGIRIEKIKINEYNRRSNQDNTTNSR